jgi:hypothetical protein
LAWTGASQLVKRELEEVDEVAAERAQDLQSREANKINAATKYSFSGKNLTAYGGLLAVAAMLEKLQLQQLVGESVNLELKRMPRAMEPSGFLLGMILAVYVGFLRLNHLQ